MNSQSPPSGFHAGEIAVQQRAGVRAQARRLVGMLGSPNLAGGPSRFVSACNFAALAGRVEPPVATRTPCYGYPR